MKNEELKSEEMKNDEMKAKIFIFTNDEVEILSDGILALINNAFAAQKLVTDHAAHVSIEEYAAKLQELNEKLCGEV